MLNLIIVKKDNAKPTPNATVFIMLIVISYHNNNNGNNFNRQDLKSAENVITWTSANNVLNSKNNSSS